MPFFEPFLEFDLCNKHGVASHQGKLLIEPSQIESVRSLMHVDHIYSHHEVGSVIMTKTGDKHFIAQHVDEVAESLRRASDRDGRAFTGRR